MSHLSEYQKSALGLLDLPQWQLQHPELVVVEQRQQCDPTAPTVTLKTATATKTITNPNPTEKTPETDDEKIRSEAPSVTFVDEILLIATNSSLLQDIRLILTQYDIPHQIVNEYSPSNLQYRLAIIPEGLPENLGKTEFRFKHALSASQKQQLWSAIISWRKAD